MTSFKWFIPSFAGDFRLEPTTDGCVLKTLKPTLHEKQLLTGFMAVAVKKGWTEFQAITNEDQVITFNAPLAKVAPILVKMTKPKDRTITAVNFSDGKVEVADSWDSKALTALAKKTEPAQGGKETSSAVPVPAKAAASVSRPTPSCPQCMPGAIAPATEALLAFLTPEEHESWAKDRAIVITGGMSGHRYLLAHRHTPRAQKMGRMAMDLDDRVIVHFHDWSVPPEEEVLAAKLILEHREPWLRNEATLFGNAELLRYKNPFGNGADGVESAELMRQFGEMMGVSSRIGDYV